MEHSIKTSGDHNLRSYSICSGKLETQVYDSKHQQNREYSGSKFHHMFYRGIDFSDFPIWRRKGLLEKSGKTHPEENTWKGHVHITCSHAFNFHICGGASSPFFRCTKHTLKDDGENLRSSRKKSGNFERKPTQITCCDHFLHK